MKRKTPFFLLFLLPVLPAMAEKAFTETLLLGFDQPWRIHDSGEAPPENWNQNAFEDTDWEQTDGFVSSMSDPERQLRFGTPGYELAAGIETAYLRTTFTLPRLPVGKARLVLDLVAKDGAVFYLNGHEIGRTSTMPKGPLGHETRPLRAPRPRLKTGFFIDPDLLQPGENLLAVSLHGYTDAEIPPERVLALELVLFENFDLKPVTAAPRHVRVRWRDNPQEEAVISWTTSEGGRSHHLYYDTVPHRGKAEAYAHEVTASRSGPVTLTRADIKQGMLPATFVHVHLDGLKPDTTYYFMAETDNERSGEFHFRTAPDDDRPIQILFGGDSRVAGMEPYFHHDRRSMNRRMAALTEEHSAILALLHGGDFAQLAQWRFLEPWLTDHELTRTQDGRILPVITVRGNHDRDIGFEEVFWWPEESGDHYYKINLTPRIAIVVLNTEMSLGGRQQQWLEQTLARARPESRWLLTAYHRPAWPSVRGFKDGANRRRFWVPHFDRYRVDLSLESHDHAMKRTVPILNETRHPEGIVYIGDGGLGVPQRNPDPTRWYLQGEGLTKSVHHVHILNFGEETLQGTAFDMGGSVIDEFVRLLRKEVAWTASEDILTLPNAFSK